MDVNKAVVKDVLRNPEITRLGAKGRLIAQRGIDEIHVIRVIYTKQDEDYRVITFYPARRKRYEGKV